MAKKKHWHLAPYFPFVDFHGAKKKPLMRRGTSVHVECATSSGLRQLTGLLARSPRVSGGYRAADKSITVIDAARFRRVLQASECHIIRKR